VVDFSRESGETALVGALLAGTDIRAEVWPQLLAQSGGNPLYAEEYARMLRDRPQERELPLPDSVQAIITARIDAPPGRQGLRPPVGRDSVRLATSGSADKVESCRD
jgi:hypothetical protein